MVLSNALMPVDDVAAGIVPSMLSKRETRAELAGEREAMKKRKRAAPTIFFHARIRSFWCEPQRECTT